MDKTEGASWLSRTAFPNEKQILAHMFPFSLDRDIPADKETLELVARFRRGYELIFSSENVIQLICVANYLGMTESHSRDNLLNKGVLFFEQRVLPSWNATIKALLSVGCALQESVRLGLFGACLESLVEKAQVNPHLLGDPMTNSTSDEEEEDCRQNARRGLFVLDWKSEELTALPLQLYQPIIFTMSQRQIPQEYVAASLCRYAEKWVFFSGEGGENESSNERNLQRNVIEVVESLLPDEKGLIPCALLFKMLKFATSLDCSNECRNGFEKRIGKQLEEATVKDILVLSQGYSKEMQHDIECIKRIVKHFYGNHSSSKSSGLIAVADLIEGFLVEVASDTDLKMDTFISLGEISIAGSSETPKNADGMYRAVDTFFDKHRYLREHEKEEVCRMLDCHNLSSEAREHAVNNGRMPLRFVVQILLVSQLQMRQLIANLVHILNENLRSDEVRSEDKENEVKVEIDDDDDEEKVRNAVEKMSIKVMDLEREYSIMRKEIQNGSINQKMQKGKTSMWKEMKRKLGCKSSIHDHNSQVKKKKKVVTD